MTADLIALAKQAGDVETDSRGRETFSFDSYGLQAFADLIAQREREAIAALFPKSYQEYFGTDIHDAIRARTTTC